MKDEEMNLYGKDKQSTADEGAHPGTCDCRDETLRDLLSYNRPSRDDANKTRRRTCC